MNDILRRHAGEIGRAIRNHAYEETASGIYLPAMGINVGGVFYAETSEGGQTRGHNMVVKQGRNYVLNACIRGASQISTWYIALYANNVAPVDTLTASNFDSTQNEFTNYTEATRQAYTTDGASTDAKLVNQAAPAVFTFSTGGGTVYGAALVSVATKESTSGTLFSVGAFEASQTLGAGGILNVRYELEAKDGTPTT